MVKILSVCLVLLFVGTGFAASGEGEGDRAPTAQRQRVLSAAESIALERFLGITTENRRPIPLPVLQGVLYFAKDLTEDEFCSAMNRISSIRPPKGQELDILNTYFSWLRGAGKQIKPGSENDPLSELERRPLRSNDILKELRRLLNITEEDVLSSATAATHLEGSESEDEDYEDVGLLRQQSVYVPSNTEM